MKKNIVLFTLFILPIVAYLFFATGVNQYTKLPVIRSGIADLGHWPSLSGKPVSLDGKITILGFGGENLLKNRGNLFNLNEKIYRRYHDFKDLQFVMICPPDTRKDARYIIDSFSQTIDVSQWQFIFADPSDTKTWFDMLKLKHASLDAGAGTSDVFIIDKDRNLRGRKDNSNPNEGYDTFHPSALSNEMLDDFKVILYEYRAALKKNHNATKELDEK